MPQRKEVRRPRRTRGKREQGGRSEQHYSALSSTKQPKRKRERDREMRKYSWKETTHGTEGRDAERPWLAHQGLETDYPSGKYPPVEEQLQQTSWLATAEEKPKEWVDRSTNYTQRGKA